MYPNIKSQLDVTYVVRLLYGICHQETVDEYVTLIQYIPRNMHTVFALLCFVVVIHWLIFPYPSGLLHWHCGNLTIAPVPAKQPWWIWINTSCEFIMNDCITTTKQSTTKPCAYFLGYTVCQGIVLIHIATITWIDAMIIPTVTYTNQYNLQLRPHVVTAQNSHNKVVPFKTKLPRSTLSSHPATRNYSKQFTRKLTRRQKQWIETIWHTFYLIYLPIQWLSRHIVMYQIYK